MPDVMQNVYPVLLAGGMGTRLWPVSRALYPKQLVKFIGNESLLQTTIKRLTPLLDLQNVRVVCGEKHFQETARHMQDIGLVPEEKVIVEPSGRNTAPAILLAAFHIRRIAKDSVLCIFPADHVISNIESFHERLHAAIRLAENGSVVTFGIKPNYPETGYGYIEGGADVSDSALRVKRFVEKPDRQTAEKYIQLGNFFWNSGMFAFKVSVILEEFKTHQPELLATMEEIFSVEQPLAKEDYDRLENISIDYAIMEKTDKCVVLPSDFGWSDIGSWKSLYDFLEKDANNNIIDGDVIAQDTQNCFILSHDRLIATNRLQNMVVVETPDSIFVSDLDHSRDVKSIVSELKDQGRKEYHQHRSVYHPWGISKLLEQIDNYTVAALTVYSDSFLQLPGDTHTAHHLFVIKGQAKISAASQHKMLSSGDSITCPAKGQVSIENTGKQDLNLIQVELKNPSDS
ncbi:MAG: mannose-1-phosphate guanylyltransferase/mannose-6-phosphate isomerase [Desulfobacterales bacterium]|jgi:mannose-1-phosphate guanylyltransferase/mannose-6-phosphate isomerase|nr:MAG: mannose-1-phosphate guanylyltransferase/mannose-6-phosphate isomerase [Desulfobacterales bacterium]